MRFNISVTKLNIEKGKRQNDECCPVALAMKRAKLKDVSVGNMYCIFLYNNKNYLAALPFKARSFISNFDCYKNVTPFKFSINAKKVK